MELKNGYFVTAEIRTKREGDAEIAKIELRRLEEATGKEPGCTIFAIHQNNNDPRSFILWERFEDESAYKKHFEYQHTKDYFRLDLTEVVQYYQTDPI